MDEESDEDVYFANSPLMKHLEEAGIDIKDETVIQSNKSDTVKIENTSKIHFSSQLQCWYSYMYCFIISVLGINILKEEKTNLENIYKDKLLLLAVKSKAFEAEDQQFLENFKENYEEKKELNMDPFIKSKMLTMIALPCLLAYLFTRVVYPDLPWKYKTLTDLSAICSLLYITANIVKYLILLYQRWKLEHMYDVVVNCIQTGETMVKYTQKSLRLIQESELVSRGFTLVSQKSPISRLEQNSLHHTQRQCSQLRSELFHSARNCFLVLKSAATNLVTSYPLDASIDNVMNYLCHIPIDEFGQCLQIIGHTEESTKELYTLTDGFSVASLKGLKHLFHLQQSEFLRRLTLTFIESDSSSLNTRPEISNIISYVTCTLQNNTDQLQRSYNIHSCCAISQETQSVRVPASQTSSATSDVYIAVHSLDLHLQAALLRIRSLSTIMEHQIERAEDSSNEFAQSGDSLLQQIKQELLACKGCWEEGLSRVENLLKSKEEPVQGDSVQTEKTKPLEPKPLKQCGLEDPVIEDEVFEAYNDEDEEDLIDNTWDEFLSPEEKAKKKREKEEALRVLTELKSVISFRAQDTAKREQAALQKSKGTESQNNVENDKVEHSSQGTKPDNQYKDSNQKEKLEEEERTIHVQDYDKTNAEKPVTPSSNNDENLNSEITVNSFNSINIVDSQSQYEKNQNSESIIRPKKQKYVYCPPEDEINNSTETITGPQFIALPVLGRQDAMEDRLERLSGANLSFTAMLAAQAVARSQKIGLNVQTFGDDDGDELIYDDDSFDEEDKSEDSLDHENNDNDSLNHDDSDNDSLKDNHDHIHSLRKDKEFNDGLQNDYDDNDSLKGDHVSNDANHDKHDDHDSDDSLESSDVEKHQCGEDSNLKTD